MQYIELKEQLKNFKIFNLNDIRKIEEDFYPILKNPKM